jgi:Ca2+-binding RTX toxin-like protein
VEGIYGSRQDDILTGDGAANFIYGNSGNDTLTGNGGADTLDGESGFDVYGYRDTASSNPTSGVDIIQLSGSEDRIDLSAIDADTAVAGNQAFTFATGATVPSATVVTYDPDGWVYAANDTVAG